MLSAAFVGGLTLVNPAAAMIPAKLACGYQLITATLPVSVHTLPVPAAFTVKLVPVAGHKRAGCPARPRAEPCTSAAAACTAPRAALSLARKSTRLTSSH